jgi:mannose-P-dolichol utilization defect protein 1
MVSKLLSVGILLGSMTLKVPQIMTMFGKKTAQGVSLSAEASDLFVYLLGIGYNFHYGNAFSTYGENVFLLIQTLVVIYGLVAFGNLCRVKFFALVGVLVTMLALFLNNLFPEGLYAYNMYALICISKIFSLSLYLLPL